MLVLSRRPGESIVIGNDIVVTVLEVRPDQIRLGIDAPRSVSVHREEVYQEVMRENAAAVATADRKEFLRRRLPTAEDAQRAARSLAPPAKPADEG